MSDMHKPSFMHGVWASLAVVDAHGQQTIGCEIARTVGEADLFAVAGEYNLKVAKSLGIKKPRGDRLAAIQAQGGGGLMQEAATLLRTRAQTMIGLGHISYALEMKEMAERLEAGLQ